MSHEASQVTLVLKNLPAKAGGWKRRRFSPWVGKNPWRRAWQPLQYPCLETPMDRGVWWATVRRLPQSQTRLNLLKCSESSPKGILEVTDMSTISQED